MGMSYHEIIEEALTLIRSNSPSCSEEVLAFKLNLSPSFPHELSPALLAGAAVD